MIQKMIIDEIKKEICWISSECVKLCNMESGSCVANHAGILTDRLADLIKEMNALEVEIPDKYKRMVRQMGLRLKSLASCSGDYESYIEINNFL